VQRVCPTEFAVFLHFEPVGIVLLVFLGVVVALLASLASECDFYSHFGTSCLFDFRLPPSFQGRFERLFSRTQK
jgi:hypothetical protein